MADARRRARAPLRGLRARLRRGRRAAHRAAPARDGGGHRLRAGRLRRARSASRSSSARATPSGSPRTSRTSTWRSRTPAALCWMLYPTAAALHEPATGAAQPVIAGVVASLVGFASTFALVLAGLRAVGASEARPRPGWPTLCFTMAVVGDLARRSATGSRSRSPGRRRAPRCFVAGGAVPGGYRRRARRVRGRGRADRRSPGCGARSGAGSRRSRPRSRARCWPASCSRSASRRCAARRRCRRRRCR